MKKRQTYSGKIQDSRARDATFCKRRKNIVSKLVELGRLCDLNIYLMIFNKDKQALHEYKSDDLFTSEVACRLLEPENLEQFKTKFETSKDF